MIDDIIFDEVPFILEHPIGSPGGDIIAYSLDGGNYDFLSTIITGSTGNGETSHVFIN